MSWWLLGGVGIVVMLSLGGQGARPAPEHRVLKSIRAQKIWGDSGPSHRRALRVALSRSGNAQVRFTIAPNSEIAVDANRFTVFSVAQGLRVVAAAGSARRAGNRLADFASIWMLPTGEIGYIASSQTSDVTWKEAE